MTRVLADFLGDWRLERRIDDALLGREGILSGTASFVETARGVVYEETGLLRFAGQAALTARQSYLWTADGAGVAVFFADGRAFHSIDLNSQTPSAHHDCPPDLYDVRYDFSHWPAWSSEWVVKGPAKDYRMVSRYTQGHR